VIGASRWLDAKSPEGTLKKKAVVRAIKDFIVFIRPSWAA
jgi:hypothetical protein